MNKPKFKVLIDGKPVKVLCDVAFVWDIFVILSKTTDERWEAKGKARLWFNISLKRTESGVLFEFLVWRFAFWIGFSIP